MRPLRRRERLLALGGAALLLWWSQPSWQPLLLAHGGGLGPEVISVAAGDFRRTQTAVALWQPSASALLAITVPAGDSQAMNLAVLRGAHLSPVQWARVHRIATCGDSVTEMADLTVWLARLPAAGALTVVTSPEHLPRLVAIARVMAGSRGWRVSGVGSLTSEHKPESALRLLRDALRAQLWRATGWTGREILGCAAGRGGLEGAVPSARQDRSPHRLHSPFAHLLVRPQ